MLLLPSDDQDWTAVRASLPDPPRPQGGYVPAVIHRQAPGRVSHLVVTAGMTPRVDGSMQYAGQVGSDITLAQAQSAAAIAAGNALAAALATVGADDRFEQVLRLTVYVNAAAGFEGHTSVADGASARLRELLGPRGDAARAAVGVTSLPGGACVELELTCVVSTPEP